MIAVKIGTTSWRMTETLAAGEVEFVGQYVCESDGITPAMVWDEAIQNIRARNAAEILAATKAQRITSINTECRARLLARFGDPAEQVSRSIGVYGLAEKSALETGIAATIDATNTASDAVTAATTLAEVEAVTVTWPVI